MSDPASPATPALRPLPLELLLWFLPQILAAFAVPGIMVLQTVVWRSGEVVLTPRAIEMLQYAGLLTLFCLSGMRLPFCPPPRWKAYLAKAAAQDQDEDEFP